MKRLFSFALSLTILLSLCGGISMSTSATDSQNEIDINIYKAQCILGTAYDPNTDAVEQCNKIYSYYINDEVYSPTKSFLDSVYEDDAFMASYNAWMAYSLAAEPSAAFDTLATTEQYYEALIVAIYTQTTVNNNEFVNALKSNAVKGSNTLIKNLCETKGVSDTAELMRVFDINSQDAFMEIKDCINDTYKGAKAANICNVIGLALDYSADIVEVTERLAMYGEMAELDEITKEWLVSLYNACNGNANPELKSALFNLKTASTDYAGAALADIKTAGFTLGKWVAKTAVDAGVEILSSISPITIAITSGLKLGKSICDFCFGTSDTCEQLYLLNCIYEIQELERDVIKKAELDFLTSKEKDKAIHFIYAVDCYFESLINTDIDCMISFLGTLYNGGILKGAIKWFYGTTNDYQEAVKALENLRETRQNNYTTMQYYYLFALKYNYPNTYEDISNGQTIDSVIPISGIEIDIDYTLPAEYPIGYADIIAGDSAIVYAKCLPDNTNQRAFNLYSDNPDVLSVKGNVVKAISPGKTNLIMVSAYNSSITSTKTIYVGEKMAEFNYTIDAKGNATITGLTSGYVPNPLKIPSKIDGYRVSAIGERAFRYNSRLTNVTIPESVTHIGEWAFHNCSSLISITIPDSVTSIGDYAFRHCTSLTSVTIPDSVTSVGGGAFSECSSLTGIWVDENNLCYSSDNRGVLFNKEKTKLLQAPDALHGSYTIPHGVTIIGSDAFENCSSLTSITIPYSVTIIGSDAFKNCSRLTGIWVDENNLCYSSDNRGVLFNKEQIELLQAPDALHGSYTIPHGVTIIGSDAFENCSSLTSITIPYSVTIIGSDAFENCSSLESITIPDGVKWIEPNAFKGCDSLTSIAISDSVKWIEDYAFADCDSLTSVIIPDSVTYIGLGAFKGCTSLAGVYITDLEAWCKLQFAADPLFIEAEYSNPLYYAKKLYLNDELVTDLVIPDSVTSIGDFTFIKCSSLTSITIPESVTNIGEYAFFNCTGLTLAIYCGTEEQWDAISIGSSNTALTKAERSYHKWQDGTCTTPKTCTICGDTEGEAPGHNYVTTNLVKPSFTAAGQQQKVCSVCEDTVTETLDMLVGKVSKWNIVLRDDYALNFHLQISECIESTAKVRLAVGNETVTYSASELEKTEDGYFGLTANISAAQMNDIITLCVVDGSGNRSESSSYTVREYCDTILADESYIQYHALAKEMLNYGAAAQVYFDYDTENLANDGITDVAATDVPKTAEKVTVSDKISNVNFYGASLVYRDRIAVRYYFTGDVTGCTFTANGNTYTPVPKDGMYYIEIADILPQNLDQAITLTVTDANGNTMTVAYSPMNYIVRMNEKGSETLKALVKALYNYHLAAKALSA